MSSVLDTVAAWPVGSAADKALQRTAVTKRFIWVFSNTEDTQNFDVVDPADGTLPLYIQWKGILFQYDSTDTTTTHDGTTCAVTADAKRYKAVAAIPTPYAVLSTRTTAQPASPVSGDTYYIPTAATGADWAGKDGQIGVYLARGWVFQAVRIGQFVYDESTDTYYHKTSGGTLTAGFGNQALGAGQVLPSNMSGGGGKVRWFVENQTTNAPPGSPTANIEYIIGSSPTGAWAGKAAQIARYENSAWFYYVPAAGWKAYDKSIGQEITYSSAASSWLKAASGYSSVSINSDAASVTLSGTNPVAQGNPFDPTSAQNSTPNMSVISETLTAQVRADYVGQLVSVDYTASLSGHPGVALTGATTFSHMQITGAVYLDNETLSREWALLYEMVQGSSSTIDLETSFRFLPHLRAMVIPLPDTSLHTIKVKFHLWVDASVTFSNTSIGLARRTLIVRKIT